MNALRPWLELQVIARREEAIGIVGLDLAMPDGQDLSNFSAGSHIDVEVAPGLVRQYSLCNAASDRSIYSIAVLRDPNSRGGSAAVHERLQVGQPVRVSEPRNHFPLHKADGRTLLFAGGIGITPILVMAERLAETGKAFSLHYCTRSRDRTAFVDRISNSGVGAHALFHFDDGPDAQRLDLTTALDYGEGDRLYVCGPGAFIDWILGEARALGWPQQSLHTEYFMAPVSATEAAAPAGEFQVRLASDGRIFDIPQDVSVVSVLIQAGIEIPVSCEQGICGTCLTRVLEGEPDHRDYFLTEEERALNDQFTPCCSRAKTSMLVLDI